MKDELIISPSEFLADVSTLSNEQTGKYIKLLCCQAREGSITQEKALRICGDMDVAVMDLFKTDECGNYYNIQLESRFEKREKYIESRRNNRLKKDMSIISQSYVKDMNKTEETKPKKTSNKETISSIISYLNEKTQAGFKANTQSTISSINARLKEGYSLVDFKRVIDLKVGEWGCNDKMQKFIRPVTLFGTKFESYLIEANKLESPKQTSLEEISAQNSNDVPEYIPQYGIDLRIDEEER